MSLYEIEEILSSRDNNPMINELAKEIQVEGLFISSNLPEVIHRQRELRKPSVHGGNIEKEALNTWDNQN